MQADERRLNSTVGLKL